MPNNFRPYNGCHTCDYEWSPRGKDLSYRCPRCNSTDTYIIQYTSFLDGCGTWFWLGVAAFILVVVLF